MDCPLGGAHDYKWDKELLKHVCSKCDKVSPFEIAPTYLELLKDNNNLKELLRKANERIKGGRYG